MTGLPLLKRRLARSFLCLTLLDTTGGVGPTRVQAVAGACIAVHVAVFLLVYVCTINPSRRVCRPRGENSNYGLVRLNNEAYLELTRAFARVNKEAPKLHVSGAEKGVK